MALDSFYDIASILAQGAMPSAITDFLKVARLTALLKPNGRVRGIASGDTFRRLVAKTIARQKQKVLRAILV